MDQAAQPAPRWIRAVQALTKSPPKVQPLSHDFAMSGVTLDGTFWRECRCGWRTTNCTHLPVAGDLLDEHLAQRDVVPE